MTTQPEVQQAADNGCPDPGPRRFWVVSHAPERVAKPMKITLRERTTEGDRLVVSMSRILAFDYSIAKPASKRETMEKILERVEDVDLHTGVFE